MFNRFFIIFLTILLPLTEGFLLAWYCKHTEPPPEPEPEAKKDGFGVKVPEINELPEEYTVEEQIPEPAAEEQTIPEPTLTETLESEKTAAEVKTEENTQPENEPATDSSFDNNEDVLQLVMKSGIMANEAFDQMLSNTPVEIAADLEKRIEENTVRQKDVEGMPDEIKDIANAFDLPDEDELLQRVTESAGKEAAVAPDFSDNKTKSADNAAAEEITVEDIAPSAVEILGADFDFETLKNSVSK